MLSFTFHARERMYERGISEEEVEATVEHSDVMRQQTDEITEYVKRCDKGVLLVYVARDNTVITVLRSSKVEKYL